MESWQEACHIQQHPKKQLSEKKKKLHNQCCCHGMAWFTANGKNVPNTVWTWSLPRQRGCLETWCTISCPQILDPTLQATTEIKTASSLTWSDSTLLPCNGMTHCNWIQCCHAFTRPEAKVWQICTISLTIENVKMQSLRSKLETSNRKRSHFSHWVWLDPFQLNDWDHQEWISHTSCNAYSPHHNDSCSRFQWPTKFPAVLMCHINDAQCPSPQHPKWCHSSS